MIENKENLEKRCTKCGTAKSVSEFGKRASRLDGLVSWCKACDAAHSKAYRASNHDAVKATNAAYRTANIDKVKASDAKYRAENKEKVRAKDAKYHADNREKRNAYNARYAAENMEDRRVNHQNRRARANGGRLSKGLAGRLLKLQRGKCACCGEPLGSDYHRDHIMPLALGGSNTDDNIQLLRKRCNIQKKAKHPVDFMQQRGFLL